MNPVQKERAPRILCTPSSPVTGNEIIATSLFFFALPFSNQFHRSDDGEQSLSRPTDGAARPGPGRGRGRAPSALALFPVPHPRIHHWSIAGGVAVVGRFLGSWHPPLSSFLVNCSTMQKMVQRTGKCGSQQRTRWTDLFRIRKLFPLCISPSLDLLFAGLRFGYGITS